MTNDIKLLTPEMISRVPPREPEAPDPRANLAAAQRIDPEAAGRAVQIARDTGVPRDIALRQPQKVLETAPRLLSPDIIANSRALTKVAKDEVGAALIKDDEELGSLAIAVNSWRRGQIGLGQQVEAVSAAASTAYRDKLRQADEMAAAGQSEAAIRQLGLEAYNFSRLPAEKRRERLLALEMQTDTAVSESAGRLAQAQRLLDKYPQGADMRRFGEAESFGEQLKIIASNPLDIMLDVLPQSFVETVPGLVAAPVAGPAAIGASAAAASYKSAFLDSLQGQGVNTRDPQALASAMRDPAVFKQANDYAIGYAGGVGFLDMLSAGLAGRVRPFGTEVWDIETRTPSLVTTTADKARNAAAEVVVQGSAGAAGEALGSGEIDPGEMFIEFFAEALVGSATEPFAVNAAISAERRREVRDAAARAVSAAAYIKQIGEMAGKTKLAKRDPGTLAQVVQDMAEDAGAPGKVYIDPDDLNEVLQQSGLTIDQFAELMPSATESIMEGYLAQTTIELPVGEMVANVASQPIYETLSQRIRLVEDGPTAVEGESLLQSSYNDQLAAEAEKIVAQMEAEAPFRRSAENLRARVERDLVASGSSPEQAAQQARLTEAYFTVAAKDWQATDPAMTPEALFERFYPQGVAMVQPAVSRGAAEFDQPALMQEDRREGERRADERGGRRVSDEQLFEKQPGEMTEEEKDQVIEELRVQLLVSSLTGLGSKIAWKRERAKNPQAFVASIDADGLAWVNDTMGHDAGDSLLAALGQAFADSGVTAYHISGDEFWMQADDEATLRDALEKARAQIVATTISTDKWSVTGQAFSYGIAQDPQQAEERLQDEKAQRQSAGLRAERKTRPAGARERGEQGYVPPEAAAGAGRAAGAGEPAGELRQGVDYQGEHRAPGPRDGAPGHDLTGGGQVYPDDVYTHGRQYYGTGSALDAEAFSIVGGLKGRPKRAVKIYRAVPYTPTNNERADVLQRQIDKYRARGIWPGSTRGDNYTGASEWYEQTTAEIERLRAAPDDGGMRVTKINAGDWVAITRGYAKEHGESVFGSGNYKIISKTVTAQEIYTNGDSIQEWGYWPLGVAGQFDQPGDEARGAYRPSTAQMRMLAKANLSTFLHESGHQFLDLTVKMAMMPDAPAAIQNRADDALAWLGIPSTPEMTRSEAWMMMALEEQRPYHEKWAETFEQYLFTGKAPSLELADLFRVFKDWLKAVYRSLKDFARINKDAALDPEVTAVMDRMLATEEQIAQAQAARAVVPLFTSKPPAMSVEAWAKYQNDLARQQGEAAEVIDQKRLADMKWLRNKGGKFLREMQKDAAEKRRAMRMQATREIMGQPVYQVRQLLEAKAEKPAVRKKIKGLDTAVDSLAVAIAKLGGLNRDAAVAEWGLDPADWKGAGPFGKPVLRRNGGMMPGEAVEILAEYGYLPVDQHGKADMNLLADLLDRESRGDLQYSTEADWGLIMGEDYLPMPDLEANPFAGARLDRGWFLVQPEQFDPDTLGKMVAKEGVNPDAVAGAFGFGSGMEMVRALAQSKPTQQAIDDLTDRKMLEAYGDIESPKAMQELVDKAIMSKAASRIVAREMRAVREGLGKESDIVKAAREAAGNIIDGLKVGGIRPDKYKLAAARAAKDAQTALGKDTGAVLVAKRGQILNIELFSAATDARARVDETLTEVRDWFKPDEKLAKTRNMDMVALARAIAADYGMTTAAASARASDLIALVAQYDARTAADLSSITAGLPVARPYKELTFSEFQAVRTVAEAVWALSRHDKRMEVEGKQIEVDAAAAAIIEELGTAGKPSPAMLQTATDFDRAVGSFASFAATLRRVEAWADSVGENAKRLIYRPIVDAVTRHKEWRAGKVTAYKDLLESIKDRLSTQPIAGPELGMGPDGKGWRFSGGKAELLHAILHTGNESNKRKLLLGRGWATLREDGTLDTSRWDAFMARMFQEGVIGKREMDFAQGVWDLMESMKPDAQKAHKAMFGYYFDEITAAPVDTPFGTYRGGYVPAMADRTDPDVSARADADDLLHAGNSFMFPTTGRGFTKARVEYNRPLELNLGALTTHIDKVSRFVNIEPAVRDVAKLLNRSDVKQAIELRSPKAVGDMLVPWLQRSAQQTVSQPGGRSDWVFRWGRTTAGASLMAGNIVNTLQQMTGLTFALTKVSAPAMMRALTHATRHPVSASQRVKLLSPWMKQRMEAQQFEMQAQVERILMGRGPLDTAKKAQQFIDANAYFMQSWMQNRVDTVVWLAAYDQALQRGSETPEADADEVVRQTQGSFAPEDISTFEGGTPFVRMFTQFYSYFGMVLNTMTTESQKAMRAGGFEGNARLLFLWFLPFAATSFIAEVIAKGAPDDEEDEDAYINGWLAMYLQAQFSVGAAMVPGLGHASQLIAGQFDDKPFNDRLQISPVMGYVERAAEGIAIGAERLATPDDEQEDLTASELRSMLAVLGLAGIPTGQVGKTAGYVMAVEQGQIEPLGPLEYAAGLVRGR